LKVGTTALGIGVGKFAQRQTTGMRSWLVEDDYAPGDVMQLAAA
jgi:hypothetical protein